MQIKHKRQLILGLPLSNYLDTLNKRIRPHRGLFVSLVLALSVTINSLFFTTIDSFAIQTKVTFTLTDPTPGPSPTPTPTPDPTPSPDDPTPTPSPDNPSDPNSEWTVPDTGINGRVSSFASCSLLVVSIIIILAASLRIFFFGYKKYKKARLLNFGNNPFSIEYTLENTNKLYLHAKQLTNNRIISPLISKVQNLHDNISIRQDAMFERMSISKSHPLRMLPAFIFGLVGIGALVGSIYSIRNSSFADIDPTTALAVESKADISGNAVLDGNIYDVNDKLNITTTTKSHKIYLSGSSRLYLNGDTSSPYYISPVEENGELTTNTWGIKVNNKYAAIPNNGNELVIGSGTGSEDDDFSYAVKAEGLPAGDYIGVIDYTVIADTSTDARNQATITPQTTTKLTGGENVNIMTNLKKVGPMNLGTPEVTIGDSACTNTNISVSSATSLVMINCKTPTKSEGTYSVSVSLPTINWSANISNAITYQNEPPTPPTPISEYTLTTNASAGSIITVERLSSESPSASLGILGNGDTIYEDDVLNIFFTASEGYTLATHKVNNVDFISGSNLTVKNDVNVVATATQIPTPTTYSYTLSYDANGGQNAPADQTNTTTTTTHTFTITNTTPTRAGYDFLGWAESNTATTALYQPGGNITLTASGTSTNKTLYAVWRLKTYSITYSCNGGSGSIDAQTKTHGQDITLKDATACARENYQVDHWNTKADGSGTNYAFGANYTNDANLELYAVWYHVYTLSYDANGGTGTPATQTQVSPESSVEFQIPTTIPVRGDYEFKGWATSKTATSAEYQPGGKITTTNLTLYAVWEYNVGTNSFVLNFDANGGTNAPATINKRTEDTSINLSIPNNTPTREGYNFLGWAESDSAIAAQYQPGNTLTLTLSGTETSISKTLYAVWQIKTYSITYSCNGGTGSIATQTKTHGTDITLNNGAGCTRTNYALDHWNTKADGSGTDYELDANYTANANLELYAVWYHVYELKYDANGGTGAPATNRVTSKNDSYTFSISSTIPTRNGYIFMGWSKNKTDVRKAQYSYDDSDESYRKLTTSNPSDTLYAIWIENTFTLSYDLNGGTGTAPTTQTKTPVITKNGSGESRISVDTTVQISSASNFTKSNYDFVGWAKTSSSQYPDYQPSDSISLTSTSTTLYIVWGTPKAVLGENGNLNFLDDAHTYKVGDTYTDNLGETKITAVYSVPKNSTYTAVPGWAGKYTDKRNSRPDVTSANFDSLFHWFKPTSLAYWFHYDNYLASVTNASNLNTSSVTDMGHTFFNTGYSAETFDLSTIDDWDVSNVTYMGDMFNSAGYSATTWSIGDLSGWDVSNVTYMGHMFYDAGYSATTWDIGDLSNWDVSNVRNMSYMFSGADHSAETFDLSAIANWDVSSVTNMEGMFNDAGYSAETFDLDLSNWDVSSVTNMRNMFSYAGYSATTWDIGVLSNWDVSSVTNMENMFSYAGYSVETFDLSAIANWDVSNVTNMNDIFNHAGFNATTWNIDDINEWDASSVTNMGGIFLFAGYNASTFELDLSDWNVSNVTTTKGTGRIDYGMFAYTGYKAKTFSINLAGWDTGNMLDMSYMFNDAGYSAETFDLDLSNWDVSSVTNMRNMFSYAGYSATTWDIGVLSNWDVSSVTNMENMFSYAGYSVETFDLSAIANWDVSSVTNMENMFSYAGYSAETFKLDLSNWDVSNVTKMGGALAGMFYDAGYSATTWDIGDLSNWDVSNVTNMGYMFDDAGYSATTWDIGDLSNWDVSNVTNMGSMFDCAGYSAETFDLSFIANWNVSNVRNMGSMFYYAGYSATTWSLGNLSNWDVSNVMDMSVMFSHAGYSAETFDLDLSNWDVSSVTNMGGMFSGAGYSATTWSIGDLSDWNVSNVTNIYSMFNDAGYSATTWSLGDLSNWDVSNVTDMGYMFSGAGYSANYSLDLSGWNVNKVTSHSGFNSGVTSKIIPPVWKN